MKAVFFDWDGTLVDSLPMLHAAHNHVRETYAMPLWDREEYMKHMLYSTRELYPRIYGERAPHAIETLYEFIKENHLNHITLIDGAEDLLESLAMKGIPMGVVSNKRDDVLKREVEHYGWEKYFGVYIGAGVAEKDKPSGAPLLYALDKHPTRPPIDNVIYVGDTESDLACAAEAGCPIVFLPHAPRAEELISQYRPAYVARNLAELKVALMEYLG